MTHVASRGCYKRGCRRPECTKANRDYVNRLVKEKAYGTWESSRVPAAPIRKHVRSLKQHGMGLRAISDQSGVARSALQGLFRRNKATRRLPAYVARATADRLLEVAPKPRVGITTNGVGTMRRLEALVAIGWPRPYLAEKIGWTRQNFDSLLLGNPVRIYTAEKVAALYDELWDQEPPRVTPHQKTAVTKSLNHARRRGWLPPAAWDDDLIDDPNYYPEGVVRVERKKGNGDHQYEDYLFLAEQGFTRDQIAARLGFSRDYLDHLIIRKEAP